eukprot:CAMPEP_0119301980 /NCGR_PEP_ID=MMETSP1333-20130426/3672_1 /TAXON_ID=418940 /ORGANISM="Scyphosphaera apsteinii, Strain RCC1455" /LENGTH=70 /DNA_ID=CAMNT_0007304203 /DNA_START=408 /DNA_END=621 /DNA_ORIENTATION=-
MLDNKMMLHDVLLDMAAKDVSMAALVDLTVWNLHAQWTVILALLILTTSGSHAEANHELRGAPKPVVRGY